MLDEDADTEEWPAGRRDILVTTNDFGDPRMGMENERSIDLLPQTLAAVQVLRFQLAVFKGVAQGGLSFRKEGTFHGASFP